MRFHFHDGRKKESQTRLITRKSHLVKFNSDVAARLSLFRLASSPAYASLIAFALNADTFQRSVVAITLDWKKPWTWIESLERWLGILEDAVKTVEAQNREVVESAREDRGFFGRLSI